MNQKLSGTIQEKELRPSLHLSVVAIEKGAFRYPSTMVTNITFIILFVNYASWDMSTFYYLLTSTF